jgi:hypothetical protein
MTIITIAFTVGIITLWSCFMLAIGYVIGRNQP